MITTFTDSIHATLNLSYGHLQLLFHAYHQQITLCKGIRRKRGRRSLQRKRSELDCKSMGALLEIFVILKLCNINAKQEFFWSYVDSDGPWRRVLNIQKASFLWKLIGNRFGLRSIPEQNQFLRRSTSKIHKAEGVHQWTRRGKEDSYKRRVAGAVIDWRRDL